MQERDEALDFIYKGWREGRQQRRGVMNQRGAERIAARRERMGRYGSPSSQNQNMRGPPSRSDVASSPPSSKPYVSPVQQYLNQEGLQKPQEQTSSTTTGNFTDDISTPDDESTPQNEAIQEAVSSPPSLDQAFSNLGVPEHRPTGGANVGRHDYVNEGFPERTPDITQNVPSPAEPSPKPNEDLGNRMTNPDADPFPTNYTKLPEEDRQGIITELGDKSHQLAQGTERYEQAVKDGVMTQEQATNSINQYKDMLYENVPEEGGYKPKDRTIPEATRSDKPFDPPTREATIPDEIDFGHEPAFNEAYNGMVNDGSEVAQGVNRGINESFKEFNRIGRELGSEAEAQPTPEPQPDPTVAEVAPKAAPTKEETAKELFARVQNAKDLREGREPENTVDDSKLDEKGKKAAEMFEEVQARKRKRQAQPTPKPQPDPTVAEAAKNTIKPVKNATEKGKGAVRTASEKLANAGMTGKKPEEPKKSKKAADKKKEKDERKKQDLTGIKTPNKTDLRRSADQQMLADVLLKKLPVADLRMFQQATGIQDIAPLLDDKGFMTQVVGITPSHSMMMGLSDTPDFEQSIQPAIGFDLEQLKFSNAFTGFSQARKPHIEDLYMPPMKTMPVLDDEGKKIKIGMTKNTFGENKPIYQTEEVEDEDIGYFIRDGKERRRMTKKEAQEILGRKVQRGGLKSPTALGYASPYYKPKTGYWQLPIIEAKGKQNTLPKSPFKDFSFVEARPLDSSVVSVPDFPLFSDYKEIASFTPKELKERFKGLDPKKNRITRIGESTYNSQYLKDLVSGMNPSKMPDEDIRFSSRTNHPLLSEGRGVVRYDEDPSYWKHMLAPRIESSETWESMNDLFE